METFGIQVLGIVDQADHRGVGGGRGQQIEQAKTHQESIGRRALDPAGGDPERDPLPVRQGRDPFPRSGLINHP